jgi:hypothetical protein
MGDVIAVNQLPSVVNADYANKVQRHRNYRDNSNVGRKGRLDVRAKDESG